LYINPYTDNQNLFDAFLAHTTLDAAALESRPLLRYTTLDLDRKFACAEGHAGEVEGPDGLVTFHFWSSDFRTREVSVGEEAGAESDGPELTEAGVLARIRTRDGIERVAKATASKAELFEMFLGEEATKEFVGGALPRKAIDFLQHVRVPNPGWRGMCSVTAVGVEQLVDERLLQGDDQQIDWDAATTVEIEQAPHQEEIMLKHAFRAANANPLPCTSIDIAVWVDAMRRVVNLEESAVLTLLEATRLKSRLRRLDVGTLMTVTSFVEHSDSRLASELRQMLDDELTVTGHEQ